MKWDDRLRHTREELDRISPSFCRAKWTQSTLHLHLGATHSCHHNPLHNISLEALKDNPSALHNTPQKRRERAALLRGEQPEGCQYCWQVEAKSKDVISDRIVKSAAHWSRLSAQEILDSGDGEQFLPRFLEVAFSHNCNLKCGYCNAQFSSRWATELAEHGPFPSGEGLAERTVLAEKDNPWIQSFWELWPTLSERLQVLRITGGEPLLAENFWLLLQKLKSRRGPPLRFTVNSNLNSSGAILDRLIQEIEPLLQNPSLESVRLYASIDGWGEAAEYQRHGLNFDLFRRNLETLLARLPRLEIGFMSTFGILSVSSFDRLLDEILELRRRFPQGTKTIHLPVNVAYLRQPEHLSLAVIPHGGTWTLGPLIEKMRQHQFTIEEIEKMENAETWWQRPVSDSTRSEWQRRLRLYLAEHDRRRGTDFRRTFPELST